METLLRRTYRRLHGAFERARQGGLACLLDAEFENFEVPEMAKQSGIRPTPSNIVLGTDDAIIKSSEIGKYEEILALAKKKSRQLRMLDGHMDRINAEIWGRLMDTMIVHRGMRISEFCTIARMGGVVGLHRRTRYAARNDFVSCSVDADEAALYARKTRLGLVVSMDVSRVGRPDYAQVAYEARRDIRVTRRGRHVYRPYEMFGGSHAGMFMREREIHLRNGARPAVTGVVIPGARTAGFLRRMNEAVRALEATQGRKIRIKYIEGGQ